MTAPTPDPAQEPDPYPPPIELATPRPRPFVDWVARHTTATPDDTVTWPRRDPDTAPSPHPRRPHRTRR